MKTIPRGSRTLSGCCIVLLTVLIGCTGCGTVRPEMLTRNEYTPGESWRTASPEELGVDSDAVRRFVERIERKSIDLHGLVVIKDGHLVTDVSVDPYATSVPHDIASVTKSVMAVVVGIAMDRGYFTGPDQLVSEIFRDHPVLSGAKAFSGVTIGHVLSMTSGIESIGKVTEETPFAETTLLEMLRSNDWERFVANLEQIDPPGTRFSYSSINYHILSMAISEACGMNALAFAEEHLFRRIGIGPLVWPEDPHGNNRGWGDLRMSLHDLARFAYLIGNRGMWGDERIVSFPWLSQMLTAHGTSQWTPVFTLDYGYGWFLPKGVLLWNCFIAMGRGGQCVYVFPEENALVVTAGNYDITDLLFEVPRLTGGRRRSGELNDVEPAGEFSGEPVRVVLHRSERSALSREATDASLSPEDWRPLLGEWEADGNIFGISEFRILAEREGEERDGDVKFALTCPVFQFDGVIAVDGRERVSLREADGVHVRSSASKDGRDGITVVFDEIESINTFRLTFEFGDESLGEDSLALTLYEHILLPRSYRVTARRSAR
ncbi:MAG: serine hydrolase domain-containing protein [Spirochaetota bacterium]